MVMKGVLAANGLKVLDKRYLDEGSGEKETPDRMFDRVSGGNQEYRDLMAGLLFLPNSPTLFNLGTKSGGTLSACFVFDVADSLNGDWPPGGKKDTDPNSIIGTAFKASCVAKAGGGVGYYLGNIRPEGSLVRSVHRKACGPVTVLRWLNGLRSLITQGGKRDLAQMGVLPCWHQDAPKFIHVKDLDPQALSSFNISLAWTNEWLKRVDWDRIGLTADFSPETRLWMEHCSSAWKSGCPGILFDDRINYMDPTPHLGRINATNPCVTGDTMILTKSRGWVRIDQVVGEKLEVWNGENWSETCPKVTGRDREIVRVKTDDGLYLDCTLTHRFVLADGTKVNAKDLKPGDRLEKYGVGQPFPGSGGDVTTAYLAGFYCGDGWENREKGWQEITFYGPKVEVAKSLEGEGLVTLRLYQPQHDRQFSRLNVRVPDKGTVPLNASVAYRLGWLAGLIDSDGCQVYSDKSRRSYGYQVSSTDKKFLRDVVLLLRGLGVPGKVVKSKESERKEIPGGDYMCKKSFTLCIAASSALVLQELGLKTRRVPCDDNNPQREAVRFVKVVSVKPVGTAGEVFCFTEPGRNRGVFNGILTANCGETPNRNNEPCNLGSLAVCRMIRKRYNGTGVGWAVDWDAVRQFARLATRFLDDILDWNTFPHPDITAAALATRKLGLGVMGWADLLAILGIPYDSNDGVELGREVMKTINDAALEESITLAARKGVYPGWESWDPAKDPFAGKNGENPHPKARNSTRTSIAPTGTISIIADVYSGIEPYYAEEADRTTCEGMKLCDGIPEWVRKMIPAGHVPKTAKQVHWSWHIRHQAAFQQNTDLGVSKTINMPNTATVKDVSDAYKMMWDNNCKGGTIFRDGCRNEQVLVEKPKSTSVYAVDPNRSTIPVTDPTPTTSVVPVEDVLTPLEVVSLGLLQSGGKPAAELNGASNLPSELPTLRKKFKVGGTKFYVHAGYLPDGSLVEVFIRSGHYGSETGGWVDQWCRQVSMSIQAGIPLSDIVRFHRHQRFEPHGFTGDKEFPVCSSIPDLVVQWLDVRFPGGKMPVGLPKGAVVTVDLGTLMDESQKSPTRADPCPDCGGGTKYEENCRKCLDPKCGWSRCG